jgi:RNA polymerase sigma factor (sigma-70 family)
VGDLDEAALLAAFRAKDEACYEAFFALLMPAIRSIIRSRWKSLRYAHGDMEGDCLERLIEWRGSGHLREDETIRQLAERLVNASALVVTREEERDERLVEATQAIEPERSPDTEEKLVDAELRQRVWKLQSTLEPKHQRVLEAYAQAEREDRSIAEILGVTEENGRKMAQRAREALAQAIRRAKLTAPDFLDGDADG